VPAPTSAPAGAATAQPVAALSQQRTIDQLRKLIAARYSLVYLLSWEEARVEAQLRQLAKSGFSSPLPFYQWSLTAGLEHEGEKLAGTEQPIAALEAIIRQEGPGLFVLKDFHPFLKGDPLVVRKLRDVYQALKESVKTVFLLSPLLQIPEELVKEISVVDFDLPSYQEMEELFDQMVARLVAAKRLEVQLDPKEKNDLIKSVLGLTLDEARQALTKAMVGKRTLDVSAIETVLEEKRELVRKIGMLEYVPMEFGVEDIGGMEVLKEWLHKRAGFFTAEAQKYRLAIPKGVLLTGVSGCGKSLTVKAIATYWRMPLFRLDVSQVYGGIVGSPEASLRRALKTVEACAPAVLWIDEIENGVAGYHDGDGGLTGRIFALFLTWMQEKKAPVFVAATANKIDILPAEILRKGRFDEVFFVDLPNPSERRQVFEIHLRRRQVPLDGEWDLVYLAKSTEGFNGAEIEQAVISALYDAYAERRALQPSDLYRVISNMVPLSTTMSEQIKTIKAWAYKRAVKASR
jgi:ATP-dependent 26S proteasome regulatory subunit